MSASIVFDHVSKTFATRNGEFKALDDVSFEVPEGSFFGVMGSSGAGKSTLIRTVNGLERPSDGTVTALGRDPDSLDKHGLAELRRSIGMIFQQYNLLASKTIAQNVAIPLVLGHASPQDIKARVAQVLELVGLADRADHYPSQLSGGQCQRVAIARALVTNPRILLSDEATSALDPITTRQILDLLNDISAKTGITVLLITHQMSVIARACQQVVVMAGGKVIERGKVSEVFSHPAHNLTRQFVETVIPRQLPEELTTRIEAGEESTVVRVRYRADAVRHIVDILGSAVHPERINLLHANENRLRDMTLGQLVLGLEGLSASDAADGDVLRRRLSAVENDDLEFEVLHV